MADEVVKPGDKTFQVTVNWGLAGRGGLPSYNDGLTIGRQVDELFEGQEVLRARESIWSESEE